MKIIIIEKYKNATIRKLIWKLSIIKYYMKIGDVKIWQFIYWKYVK